MSDITVFKKKSNEIRREVADDISRVLTDYETSEILKPATEWMSELYHVLVKIQNNWEYITGN